MSEVAMLPELEVPAPDPRAGRYVIFRLAHGEFGIAVDKVREVMELIEITVVPNAPAFIAGVVNVRGKVIPVVDLRRTFELNHEPQTARSCIMVVRAMLAGTKQAFGLVVDEVVEVMNLQSGDFLEVAAFEPVWQIGDHNPAPYLIGVARAGGRIKLLIDLDEVLNNLDLRPVTALPSAA